MPESTGPGDMTRLLQRHASGSSEAFDELVALAYEELVRLARRKLRGAHPSNTLDTVGLVHEAYLRLSAEVDVDWQDRSHFYAVVSRAMRFVVVDHARRKLAKKRGSGERGITLDPERVAAEQDAEVVLAVNDAIGQLESFNERLALIVEYRFFAGMSEEEIAGSLDVSVRTVQRDWRRARAWLQRLLADEAGTGGE